MDIDRCSFLEGISNLAESVYSFHERFQIPSVEIIDSDTTFELFRERLLFLSEETGEHASALNRGDLEGAVQEAVDIAYIAIGTVLRLGFTGRSACFDVTKKNDAKTVERYGKLEGTGKVVRK